MPAKKKHSSTRARRNKTSGAATLTRVTSDTEHADVLNAMTVVQLRALITSRNKSRPSGAHLSSSGTKPALVAALLNAESTPPPTLPKHPPVFSEDGKRIPVQWDTQTLAWWADVWASPMSSEWDESDLHNVIVVALLYDDIWAASSAKERKDALAEYRLQRADLGLSPYSRRRLEWTIETAADAKDRGEKRRSNKSKSTQAPPNPDVVTDDPRAAFHVVS